MAKVTQLDILGENLVSCNLKCDGINNNPQKGIIPRCLVLEPRKGNKKCIVVGLNPGKSSKKEQEYYLTNGISYKSLKGYFFNSGLRNRAYFKRTRDLVSKLGYASDILWTDLAKCELVKNVRQPPVQTLRVCISRFLRNEIKLFKVNTIFALGNVAFNFCALSFPKHFVIGLPHPTGSYGNFFKLRNKVSRNRNYYRKEISQKKDQDSNQRALKLS